MIGTSDQFADDGNMVAGPEKTSRSNLLALTVKPNMNKLLSFGVAVVVTLGIALPAFAAVDCTVTPNDPSCHGGNGSPALISTPWGLLSGETPTFAPGMSIQDGYGHTLTCPWWFPFTGCYDITKTAYYRTTVLGLK